MRAVDMVQSAEAFNPNQLRGPDGRWIKAAVADLIHDTDGRGVGFEARVRRAKKGASALRAAAPRRKLSPAQVNALDQYGIDTSYDINAALREGSGDLTKLRRPEKHRPIVEGLDSAMEPLTSDVVVYRKLHGDHLFGSGTTGADLTGRTFTDAGFVSTSTSERRGATMVMRILAPKGTPAISHSYLEHDEIVLGRGQAFRVVADHGKPGGSIRQIDVEIVPSESRREDMPVSRAVALVREARQADNTSTVGGKSQDLSKHPHAPAGSPTGGQFAKSGGTGSSKGHSKAVAKVAKAKTATKHGVLPPPPTTSRTMKLGQSGDDVRNLQYAMGLLGFKVPQDGVFDANTQAAVAQAQQRLGIKPTGHASGSLLRKMQDAVRLSPCVKESRSPLLQIGRVTERFNPNEPRIPGGHEGGGRFASLHTAADLLMKAGHAAGGHHSGPPARPTAAARAVTRAANRERNQTLEHRGKVGGLLAELDQMLSTNAEPHVFEERLAAAEADGIDPATVASLRKAVGDKTKLRAALTRVGNKHELKSIGRAGQSAKYDPALHEPLGAVPADGAQVRVVTRGMSTAMDGREVQLSRAKTVVVEPKSRAVAKVAAAKKAAPAKAPAKVKPEVGDAAIWEPGNGDEPVHGKVVKQGQRLFVEWHNPNGEPRREPLAKVLKDADVRFEPVNAPAPAKKATKAAATAAFDNRVASAAEGRLAVRDAAPLDLEDEAAFRTAVGEDAYKAVKSYRGPQYGQVQAAARDGKPDPLIAHIDDAMQASPLSRDVVVYRGISERGFERDTGAGLDSDLTGTTFHDAAYTSTAYSSDIGRGYANKRDRTGVFMRILVPKGTHGITMSDGEAELALERGLTFRIVADHGVEDFGRFKHRRLDVEVLPASPVAPTKAATKATKAAEDPFALAQGMRGPLGRARHNQREEALLAVADGRSPRGQGTYLETLQALESSGYIQKREDGHWKLTDQGREYVKNRAPKSALRGDAALAAAPIHYTTSEQLGKPSGTLRGADATPAQLAALDSHSQGGFRATNRALRSGVVPAPAAHIDALMAQSKLTDSVEVERGIRTGRDVFGDPSGWPDSLVGKEFTDPAYVSTGTTSGPADLFATTDDLSVPNGVKLRIKVPAGTGAIAIGQEHELLLERGLHFRVVGDSGKPSEPFGARVLDVEVVPKPTKAAEVATKAVPSKAVAKVAGAKASKSVDLSAGAPTEGRTVAQLRQIAAAEGISLPRTAPKAKLVQAIADHRATPSAPTHADGLDALGGPQLRVSGRDALTAGQLDLSGVRKVPGVTDAERKAADLYAGDAQRINALIREGRTGSATIRHLDGLLDRSTVRSDVELWRGLRSGEGQFGTRLAGDLTGAEFTEPAYLSTTANRQVAEEFAGSFGDPAPVVMHILAPAGTNAITISDWGSGHAIGGQAEVLLRRGLRMRVVADHGVEPHPQIPAGVRRLDVEIPVAPHADGLDALEGPQLRKWADEMLPNGGKGMSDAQMRAALRADGVGSPEAEHAKRLAEDVATPAPSTTTPAAPVHLSDAQIESKVREVYAQLVDRPGIDFVSLADVRDRLPDIPRSELDRVLVAMAIGGNGVGIYPESNQKMLKQRHRDAAVSIGNQDKHLLKIQDLRRR